MRNYLLVVITVVCWAGVARADVPAVVGYDGVLFTCQSADAGCGGYSLDKGNVTVSLWDDAVSTDATAHKVWGDTFTVTTDGGYYHVDLGSGKALSSDAFAGPRWMEIQVGSDAALTPRAPVMSVPFAMACGDSVSLQGKAPTAFAQAGHVHVFADVTGLQAALDGKAAVGHNHDDLYYGKPDVDAKLAGKADAGASYTTQQSDAKYASMVHGHAIGDVVGLQTELDGKAQVGASYLKAESDALFAMKSLEATVGQLQASVTSLQGTVATLQTQVASCQSELDVTLPGLVGSLAASGVAGAGVHGLWLPGLASADAIDGAKTTATINRIGTPVAHAVSSLYDDFQDGVVDAALWTATGATEAGGVITASVGGAQGTASLQSTGLNLSTSRSTVVAYRAASGAGFMWWAPGSGVFQSKCPSVSAWVGVVDSKGTAAAFANPTGTCFAPFESSGVVALTVGLVPGGSRLTATDLSGRAAPVEIDVTGWVPPIELKVTATLSNAYSSGVWQIGDVRPYVSLSEVALVSGPASGVLVTKPFVPAAPGRYLDFVPLTPPVAGVVDYFVSTDGGTTFNAAVPNALVQLPAPATSVVVKTLLNSTVQKAAGTKGFGVFLR